MNNNELTEREKRVLKLRYGLINGEFMSLTEVGRSLRVTRERIRQIEAKAISKISRSGKIKPPPNAPTLENLHRYGTKNEAWLDVMSKILKRVIK